MLMKKVMVFTLIAAGLMGCAAVPLPALIPRLAPASFAVNSMPTPLWGAFTVEV